MPRYRDNWLIDRVMFDYVSGGSCACCGLAHNNLFLPNGTADLIAAMSDLESDQAHREVRSLHSPKNPWPKGLQDQVWTDRVRLRQHMKRDMPSYRAFWQEHGSACRERMTARRTQAATALLKRVFQVSRGEISLVLSERYNIHSAYGVVLCAALEQVACFELTGYEPDGPADSVETDFESVLVFDKRRGFTLKHLDELDSTNPSDSESNIDHALNVFFRRLESLGGPTLLERPRRRRNDSIDDDSDGGTFKVVPESSVPSTDASEPSFQSDRRILRLLIARYFADQLRTVYLQLESRPASVTAHG